MKNKTLYFRSRGGPTHGWGNIIRLGAFAAYCRDHGHEDILFFVEGPKEVTEYLQNHGFKVVELPEDIQLRQEGDVFSNYPRSDILVMEMEDCNYYRQTILKKHTKNLVVFDDLLDHIYCADIVVCGQALPYYGNKVISNSKTQFLTGLDYFLFRPEFIPYKDKKRKYSESINSILISLGGGRYDVGYLKAAHAIAVYNEPIQPTFILGYAVQDELKREIQKILPQAKIYSGVKNIDEIFWDTDLAIVSGGYNKLEAAITATPAMMTAVQWHQIPLAEEFAKLTGIPYLGYMSYLIPESIVNQINKLKSSKNRKELSCNSRAVIDGNGFERVYSVIFS